MALRGPYSSIVKHVFELHAVISPLLSSLPWGIRPGAEGCRIKKPPIHVGGFLFLRLAGGTDLIVALGARLEQAVGPAGRWLFLTGVWAAVFSSLLGVWQAVPYIFADTCAMLRPALKGRRSMLYRGFLLAIAVVPLVQVTYPLVKVQKYYAVMGAAFIPLLAVALLILNGRAAWVGARFRNRPLTVAVLLAALGFFLVAGVLEIRSRG